MYMWSLLKQGGLKRGNKKRLLVALSFRLIIVVLPLTLLTRQLYDSPAYFIPVQLAEVFIRWIFSSAQSPESFLSMWKFQSPTEIISTRQSIKNMFRVVGLRVLMNETIVIRSRQAPSPTIGQEHRLMPSNRASSQVDNANESAQNLRGLPPRTDQEHMLVPSDFVSPN
jgi:hypothetical protein